MSVGAPDPAAPDPAGLVPAPGAARIGEERLTVLLGEGDGLVVVVHGCLLGDVAIVRLTRRFAIRGDHGTTTDPPRSHHGSGRLAARIAVRSRCRTGRLLTWRFDRP